MKPFRALWRIVRRRLVADPADPIRVYQQAERRLGDIEARLARESDPAKRAAFLRRAADARLIMARTHDDAFGPETLAGDAAGTYELALMWSAALYEVLAGVETAVAYPYIGTTTLPSGPRSHLGPRHPLSWYARLVERAAGPTLDRMASTRDLLARMAVTEDLYADVVELVGSHAAETVSCLRAPGWGAWYERDGFHDYGGGS